MAAPTMERDVLATPVALKATTVGRRNPRRTAGRWVLYVTLILGAAVMMFPFAWMILS